MEVTTVISIGELLDKYSILEIKSEMIEDENKLKYIKEEMKALEKDVLEHKSKCELYYLFLKDINKTIWDLSDEIRLNPGNTKACVDIIHHNDRRFRVKNKINRSSLIKEQKAYPEKKICIFPHRGSGDQINNIGMIRYLSTCYDLVRICTNTVKLCEELYSDDPQIEIVFDNTPQYCTYYDNHIYYESLRKKMPGWIIFPVYYFGESPPGDKYPYDKFYDAFYLQLGIPIKYRYLYNYIPRNIERERAVMEKYIPKDTEYIFVHGRLDKVSVTTDKFVFDVGSTEERRLILLLDYMKIIENASEIHVDDSSFFCLANYMDLSKVKKLVVYRHHTLIQNKNGLLDSILITNVKLTM